MLIIIKGSIQAKKFIEVPITQVAALKVAVLHQLQKSMSEQTHKITFYKTRIDWLL